MKHQGILRHAALALIGLSLLANFSLPAGAQGYGNSYSYGGVYYPTIKPLNVQPLTVQPVTTPQSHNGQYGTATYYGNAYQPPAHNGQYGSVTYFGARPATYPTHNGQYGGVTFLGGARPYSYGGQGSHGSVTIIAPQGCTPTANTTSGTYGSVTRFGCR